MTNLEALHDLLTKVKVGGVINYQDTLPMVRTWRAPLEYFEVTDNLEAAYGGSLDAAKALHETVLDDYLFLVGGNWVEVWLPFGGDIHKNHARNDIPARAWLMAILSALIAWETAHD